MDLKILVVDDDPVTLAIISKILDKNNYFFYVAKSANEALDILKQNPCSILLTDISMPGMDGKELISYVKKHYPEIVSIAMSASVDVDNLLATLNENKAFSYLLKPLDAQNLVSVLAKAFAHFQRMQKAEIFSLSEQQLYMKMMDTFSWRDELHSKHVTSIAKDIIRQLNISFAHGGGVGSLLSALGLLFSIANWNKERKVYEVPKDLFELISNNYKSSNKMIESFSGAQTILMDDSMVESTGTVADLYDALEKTIAELDSVLQLKQQNISVSSLPQSISKRKLYFDRENIMISFKELLINAMKYSEKEDQIYIMFFKKESYFEIKILNPAYPNDDGTVGITADNERYVFEPFFRLSTIVDENFAREEQFGYGLGLPIVKKIILQHNANIFIYTVKNLSLGTQGNDISVTLRFNLLE